MLDDVLPKTLCNHATAFHKKNARSMNDCMVSRGIHLIAKLYGMQAVRVAVLVSLLSGIACGEAGI